ncbi:MAG: DEAD/DEAH box helicase family protein [Lachnospiraceae bacterium]|nr:DEAD/DEAH box helicase family protein [Lachnospiraceae bacterium]
MPKTPEQIAREAIDRRLIEAGWVIQDMDKINLSVSLGVAIREFPTSTGRIDYALFIDGKPVGVVEAKKDTAGQNITIVEDQSSRYAQSTFKYLDSGYEIRFAYEATGQLTRFTDFHDISYRSRNVFSFHQPEKLAKLIAAPDTVRNNLKHMPAPDKTGFRKCQEIAIENLDESFAENRPRALVQMATGAGKTFTAITESYRLLTYGKMERILFLVDTKSLGVQADTEFRAYVPNGEQRVFSDIFGVRLLKKSSMSPSNNVYISTIQRMYSILKGEELSEEDEETEDEIDRDNDRRAPLPVVYNKKYPPEFFDCIIVDECHRSIYNVWSQVLEYFDAFIIGLTATPEKRTFAFFNQNVVSEYTREKAIANRVNVGEDIYLINTEVTQNGAAIMKRMIEYRDRMTRAKRWRQMDEDVFYNSSTMDVDVVNPSQIRAVIQTYRDRLFTELFPRRKNVPKTLIFAKNDSHADDIVQIVREVFGEGNEFCKKITCKAKRAEEALSSFRNQFYPRIAVTVEMIATGTDVKPLECLIFMRDVRSKCHYEQMLGRGTRVIKLEDLKMVSGEDATEKDHFVVIDAVGVTRSKKTETRPLEYKPQMDISELMKRASLGTKDPEILTSLANRLIRLSNKMSKDELAEFKEKIGQPIETVAENLLNAFDEDVIAGRAGITLDPSPPMLRVIYMKGCFRKMRRIPRAAPGSTLRHVR